MEAEAHQGFKDASKAFTAKIRKCPGMSVECILTPMHTDTK